MPVSVLPPRLAWHHYAESGSTHSLLSGVWASQADKQSRWLLGSLSGTCVLRNPLNYLWWLIVGFGHEWGWLDSQQWSYACQRVSIDMPLAPEHYTWPCIGKAEKALPTKAHTCTGVIPQHNEKAFLFLEHYLTKSRASLQLLLHTHRSTKGSPFSLWGWKIKKLHPSSSSCFASLPLLSHLHDHFLLPSDALCCLKEFSEPLLQWLHIPATLNRMILFKLLLLLPASCNRKLRFHHLIQHPPLLIEGFLQDQGK